MAPMTERFVSAIKRYAERNRSRRPVRGRPVPSSALMAPMTERFVSAIKRYAERNRIEIASFRRGERKDERTQKYLRRGPGARASSTSARPRRRRACSAPSAATTPPPAPPIRG